MSFVWAKRANSATRQASLVYFCRMALYYFHSSFAQLLRFTGLKLLCSTKNKDRRRPSSTLGPVLAMAFMLSGNSCVQKAAHGKQHAITTCEPSCLICACRNFATSQVNAVLPGCNQHLVAGNPAQTIVLRAEDKHSGTFCSCHLNTYCSLYPS